jgi:cell division septation protein DedD
MPATIVKPATKYRVAIRDIAVTNGWTFRQLSPSIDQFTKDDAVIAVEHGPSNLITRAERLVGDKQLDTARKRGKMFDVQAWLTGQPDPDQQRYIRLSADQVRRYESGQGIAKIEGGVTVAAAVEVADTKPSNPHPKTRNSKADDARAAKAAPKPKPAPRAAKKAPAATAAAK